MADLPPNTDPIRLILGDVELVVMKAGVAEVQSEGNAVTWLPQVWLQGEARISGTDTTVIIEVHMPVERARQLAIRFIETAYIGEQAYLKTLRGEDGS